MYKDQEHLLDLIRDYADKAHGNQIRKYTADRYIVHPWRVMTICKEYTSDIPVLAAAILHDVLEDTEVSKKEIETFLKSILNADKAMRTIELVIELTDVYMKKNYPHMNRRERKENETLRLSKISADAQTIKYADIMDNAGDIVFDRTDFALVYLKECKQILTMMNKGNTFLYKRAVIIVNELLDKFSSTREMSSQSIS